MDVRLPNGKVIRNVPEGTPKDEIRAKAIRAGLATGADFGEQSDAVAQIPDPGYTREPSSPENKVKNPTVLDYMIQGAAAVPVMAGGARVLQAITRGSKAAPYAARVAEAVIPTSGKQLAFEGALGAATGVTGGLAAEQFSDPTMKTLAGTVVGAATAAPFAMGKNAFDLWLTRGLGTEALEAGRQGSKAYGQASASAQAAKAISANPNLVPTVLRASEIEQKTGVSLPMLAAANGDTTISSFLQSQMSRGENAEFAAAMKSQYEAAEQALIKAKRGVAPSMQEVDAYVKRKAAEVTAKNKEITAAAAQASQKRQQGLENINTRIQELSAVTSPGQLDTGARLTNLISAKEASIRSELSPKYEELIKQSSDAGIVLPAPAAKGLRDFVKDEMNLDVFQKFPSLYNAINKEFKVSTPLATSKTATKYKFAVDATESTKDVKLTTLDSLKREVNKALRDTTDKDQIRRLVELKKQVDGAIDQVDPAFSQPYRALDKEYATRLGMPFSEQGVVNVNRAKFVEDSVPLMTKNASSLKQVMGIIGDDAQGRKIVEDAFMWDISQNRSIINTNTGEINPAQLRRYLAQNKDKIDLVPGLRQKLETLGSQVDVLKQNRTAILTKEKEAQIEQAENLWSQAYGTSGGLRGLVRSSLGNQQQLDNLVAITSKDKVAREGVKAALIEDVLNAPGDRLELFQNNRKAFEKIFGVPESRNLELIVEASQRLKDNPFKFNMNINTISKTRYEELTGSKMETSLGEARNQVMTAARVAINHFSRYFQNIAKKDEAAEVQKFLLDPKNLENTARLMAELDDKGMSEKALGIMSKMIKNSSSTYLFGAMSGALTAQTSESPETYMPTDPSLIEGIVGQ